MGCTSNSTSERENIIVAIRDDLERVARELAAGGARDAAIITARAGMGVKLAALKAMVEKGTWTSTLEGLGLNSRVARRLMAIGRRWGAENGPAGSALFERLPIDVQSLEHLAKLSDEQLSKLVENTPNIKELGRDEIGAVVNKALGGPRKTRATPAIEALEKAAKSFLRRVVALAERGCKQGLTSEQRAAILAHLDGARQQVRDALGGEGLPPAPLPTSPSEGLSPDDTMVAVGGGR